MNSPFVATNVTPVNDTHVSGTLCLANAQLVLPDQVLHGQITVTGGVITAIVEGRDIPRDALDCGGDFIMPGMIELHTDNLERHMEPRPEVDWPHLPALIAHDAELASTGITTVFDALRVGSIHTGKGGYLPYARNLANELRMAREQNLFKISHFLHLRAEICSETLLEEMADFGPDDRVGIVSLMDHTPGQRQFRDVSALRAYVAKKRGMSECEFEEHVQNLMGLQARNGAKHEAGAVQTAKRYGAVIASHDDTTAAHVEKSKVNGVKFAEFPTTIEAAQACRENGIGVMMGAPNIVRGGSHSGNVSARELADADLLDMLSSDYIPAALVLSAFQLADIWNDIPKAIACVTASPAAAAGLTDRGALAHGLRGDLVRVALHKQIPLIRGVWCKGDRVA
ncbi:alpha-D-ribose 1-methylphosphonate 5-triphosphate diphosphatase [Yoonia sp. MH D7]